jgi:tRNA (cmo5U34)-methyltransferase
MYGQECCTRWNNSRRFEKEGPVDSTTAPAREKDTDRLFATPRDQASDFNFGKETVAVFDDMLDRSVPFYTEIQRMIGELVADTAVDGTAIYDLGCSTANTFLSIGSKLTQDIHLEFVGLDSSQDMLDRADKKLRGVQFPWPYRLQLTDLNDGVQIENASVALLVLTLQFVRPMHREALLTSLYRGLNANGCMILVEKVLGEHSIFNRLFINHYYDMKRRKGYSDIEIAQKREALENVLVPYRLEENKLLLQRVGFQYVDVFFKWYNFCGVVAIK